MFWPLFGYVCSDPFLAMYVLTPFWLCMFWPLFGYVCSDPFLAMYVLTHFIDTFNTLTRFATCTTYVIRRLHQIDWKGVLCDFIEVLLIISLSRFVTCVTYIIHKSRHDKLHYLNFTFYYRFYFCFTKQLLQI
jgi:hypothetical protein